MNRNEVEFKMGKYKTSRRKISLVIGTVHIDEICMTWPLGKETVSVWGMVLIEENIFLLEQKETVYDPTFIMRLRKTGNVRNIRRYRMCIGTICIKGWSGVVCRVTGLQQSHELRVHFRSDSRTNKRIWYRCSCIYNNIGRRLCTIHLISKLLVFDKLEICWKSIQLITFLNYMSSFLAIIVNKRFL